MSKLQNKSLLEELKDSKGYDLALLTTYSIDIDFFDRRIKSILLSSGIKNISLFVDLNKLNEGIQNKKNSDLGRHYSVFPMNIPGAFHPKVILLLGKEKAKLFVSSANLKVSSYRYNNEVFNCYSYSSDNPEYGAMIEGAVRFFIKLQDTAIQQLEIDNPKHELKDAYIYNYLSSYKVRSSDYNGSCLFIHNVEKAIIDQIASAIDTKISKIRISSPFFDSDLRSVKAISERFDCTDIDVYIQNKLNRFPVDYNLKSGIIPQKNIHIFEELADGDRNFYHGKVIEFIGEDKDYILFGSSNCTANALLETYDTDGNIEASVLCSGNKDEFGYFFSSFILCKGLKLESSFEIETKENERSFSFLYGQRKNELVFLFIKCSKYISNPVARYKDKKLNCTISKQYLVINMPLELLSDENTFFTIVISDEDADFSVNCWFLDFQEIRYFRTNTPSDSSVQYTYSDDDDDRYYEFVMMINGIITRKIESNSSWFYKRNRSSGDDEDISEADEEYDYVIDDPAADLSEDDNDYYFFRKGVISIATYYRNRLLKIHNDSSNGKSKKSSGRSDDGKGVENDDSIKEYMPLSSTNKLGRYIKRLSRNYLSDVRNSKIPADLFIEISAVVLNTIQEEYYDKKYKAKGHEEKTDDFLKMHDVIEIRHLIAKNMAELPTDNIEESDILMIISIVLDYIAEIGYYSVNLHLEDPYGDVKNILVKLNKKYGIREKINSLLGDIRLTIENMSNVFKYDPKVYVDELFGYKTGSQLLSDFRNRYGEENVSIEDEDKKFTIKIRVDDLRKHRSMPKKIITNIIDSLYETEINYSRICIIYYEKIEQYIEYDVEFVKKAKHINRVIQKNNMNGEIAKRECRLQSASYVPILQY